MANGGDLLRDLRAATLREKLWAATINAIQYRKLKNTVFVIRGSGVQLDEEQSQKVQQIERIIAEYQRLHNIPTDQQE